jgi:putative redox protein
MMKVTVEHLGSVQFEIKARQHRLISDQPEENGGFDEGMTPPELLLASLGSCAAFYAAEYLKRHELVGEGTQVEISAEKVKGPARLDQFRILVNVPGELEDKHREGLSAAVKKCLIHNTLTHPPSINLEIVSSVPAAI